MFSRIGAPLGALHGKVLLLLVFLSAGFLVAPEPTPTPDLFPPGVDGRMRWFAISGDAKQVLYPGVVASLNLRLGNGNRAAIVLGDLLVTVRGIDAPYADAAHPCTVADFEVKPLVTDTAVTLPSRSVRTLRSLGVPQAGWPTLAMIDSAANQDGCKGSTLDLVYTGTGTPVPS